MTKTLLALSWLLAVAQLHAGEILHAVPLALVRLLPGALGTNGMPASDTAASQVAFHQVPVPPEPKLSSISSAALTAVPGKPLHFTARVGGETNSVNSVTFLPFYELHHQRYSIYWRAD